MEFEPKMNMSPIPQMHWFTQLQFLQSHEGSEFDMLFSFQAINHKSIVKIVFFMFILIQPNNFFLPNLLLGAYFHFSHSLL